MVSKVRVMVLASEVASPTEIQSEESDFDVGLWCETAGISVNGVADETVGL